MENDDSMFVTNQHKIILSGTYFALSCFFNRAVANETGAFFFLINGKILHKLFKTTMWFISSYEYSETKGCQNQTDQKKIKTMESSLKR